MQSGERRPHLTAQANTGAGAIELSITGDIVRDYRLQAAEAFPSATWVELLRITNAELATWFTETAVTNVNRRFYRLISP